VAWRLSGCARPASIAPLTDGRIQPVKAAYDPQSKIDPRSTLIKTTDLVALARDRQEKPKYLRLLLEFPVGKQTTAQTTSGVLNQPPIEENGSARTAPSAAASQPIADNAALPRPILPFRTNIDAEYLEHVESFRKENKRYPTRDEDRKWGKDYKLTRDRVRELRKFLPAQVRRGGRPQGEKPGEK
jgi:hypothetical protein